MLCIITSGTENLNIIKLCQKISLPYHIVIDSLFWPYQDKEIKFTTQRVTKIMEYMSSQGSTHFILSPAIELSLSKEIATKNSVLGSTIIPLFTHYLQYSLNHSLVGKIGFVGGYSELSQIEFLFETISKKYQRTDTQNNTKKFQEPLAKRTKDTRMRGYFGRLFSPRNTMINKIIKTDLRCFKDANVDTIIPLDYSYFNFQKTITSFFNQKKQKFHKRDILETLFSNIVEDKKFITEDATLTTVYHTGSLHLISEDKKWEALLSQGGKKTIEYKTISL